MSVKKSRNEVDELLADLDNLGANPPRKSADSSSNKAAHDAQSLLDDLDSLVQSRTSTSSRTSLPKRDTDQPSRQSTPAPSQPATPSKQPPSAVTAEPEPQPATPAEPSPPAATATTSASAGWSGWGSSLFSQATKLADQARAELEKRAPAQAAEQARELSNRGWDLAKGVRGFVKDAGLEKWGEVGKRGWTDIVNAVAPPIAAHEVLQVTLSHDMIGYDGIEDVTYRVLAKVMEQVDSSQSEQQLVVNKAPVETSASRPKQVEGQDRDLNAVEGFDTAFRLAKVNLDEIVKTHEAQPPPAAPSATQLPITTSPVFVRIQACISTLPGLVLEDQDDPEKDKQLFFLILLQDPVHGLSHKTISQAIPNSWLQVPFEENLWVEDAMVDVLSNALNVIGQDYVQGRMSGRTVSSKDGLASTPTKPSE